MAVHFYGWRDGHLSIEPFDKTEPGVRTPDGSYFSVDWEYGTDLMSEILGAINYVAKQKAPFKIETEGYKVYWAGTILRVDINQTELE